MENGEDVVIKVENLVELLRRLEWEAKLVRLALLELPSGTTFKVSPELAEHLQASVPVKDQASPPC